MSLAARLAVRNGVRFLDRTYGRETWLDRVDPETLSTRSSHDCPLAQVSGKAYFHAIDELDMSEDSYRTALRAVWRGFQRGPDNLYGYADLDAEWTAVIRQLRDETGRREEEVRVG